MPYFRGAHLLQLSADFPLEELQKAFIPAVAVSSPMLSGVIQYCLPIR